jgi:hypothetical protein
MSAGGGRPLITHIDAAEGWEQDEETGGLVHLVCTSDADLHLSLGWAEIDTHPGPVRDRALATVAAWQNELE